MPEMNVVNNTKTPKTRASLLVELRALGIQPNDTLLVHSSLSKLGWVCGGAQTVVQALEDAVCEGTLCMPTHSGDLSNPEYWSLPAVPESWFETIKENMPAFDPNLTVTRGMGKIPECFRRDAGVLRSEHPLGSFAAKGKYAARVTEGHRLDSQFGMASPLGKLYELGAKILLLGVGYGNCTSFHLAESLVLAHPTARCAAPVVRNGVREWVEYTDCEYDSDDFPALGADYEASGGQVTKGKVGDADCLLLNMRPAVQFAARWLAKRPAREEVKLETERLILRRPQETDADDIYEYAANPNVGPRAGWAVHTSRDETRMILAGLIEQNDQWAIVEKASGKLIGMLGATSEPLRKNDAAFRIGYVLSEPYWGRGYMPEAVCAMLKYLFETQNADIVGIGHFPTNAQSRRVIEKCGFVYEGLMRRAFTLPDGTVTDELMYSMTKEEFAGLFR